MAAQRFKQLRQLLRAKGVYVQEREYRRTRQGQVILGATCGRAIYQQAKKAVLRG